MFPCQACTTAATVKGLLASWFSIFQESGDDNAAAPVAGAAPLCHSRLCMGKWEALRVFRTLLAEAGLPHAVAGTGTGCTGDGECYGEHSPSE